MNCPIGKTDCEGCESVKEGLCDYPYKLGMTYEECREVTRNQTTNYPPWFKKEER